ncbi:hypothetical protein BDR07DRAFT_1419043 [Suillus spraguei]|nr:hypothetical protein BDR07DRAFT_1419043 [Suillus spraguei]
MYNSLSPCDQAFQVKLTEDKHSTHFTADLTFRCEDVKFVSLDAYYDIPHSLINLAKSKMYVPLTLLTYPAIKKLHAGEDISTFPPEDMISAIYFRQISYSLIYVPDVISRIPCHRGAVQGCTRSFACFICRGSELFLLLISRRGGYSSIWNRSWKKMRTYAARKHWIWTSTTRNFVNGSMRSSRLWSSPRIGSIHTASPKLALACALSAVEQVTKPATAWIGAL